MMQQSRSTSYLFGGNAPYVEELYEAYLGNPGSVPDNWRAYFDNLRSLVYFERPAPAAPALLTAAKDVIANWEHGDLAAAVRELAAAVATADDPAQAAHLLHRGGHCPACGSGDICGDSFEYDGSEHWQEVNCWTCGASWTDVYRLAGFTELKKKGLVSEEEYQIERRRILSEL